MKGSNESQSQDTARPEDLAWECIADRLMATVALMQPQGRAWLLELIGLSVSTNDAHCKSMYQNLSCYSQRKVKEVALALKYRYSLDVNLSRLELMLMERIESAGISARGMDASLEGEKKFKEWLEKEKLAKRRLKAPFVLIRRG